MSEQIADSGDPGADPGSVRARVTAEHRGGYQVTGGGRENAIATLAGTLRDAIRLGEAERPAVGDWVVLVAGDQDAPQIERVLPRRTCLSRRAAGRAVREQVVAANVDVVLIVCALGRDVNPRRIERFATLAWASGARPALVLTKADLDGGAEAASSLERARAAAPGMEVHVVSALTGAGMEALVPYLGAGSTLVLLGTSGAGKSTLVNAWLGRGALPLATAPLGAAGKGQHTTTTRQMIALPSGAVVIDTPGVREVGLWASASESTDDGLAAAFADVVAHAGGCRFSDCAHAGEPGCSVARAAEEGLIDPARVEAWRRLRREQAHAASQADPVAAHRSKSATRSAQRALRSRLREKRRGE